MNNKILFVFVLLVLALLGLWSLLHKKAGPAAPAPNPVEVLNQPPEKPPTKSARPRVGSESPVSEEVMRYVQDVKADPQYDWKQAINFYGKVVDDSTNPVTGANVRFKWTDLSTNGTSEADAQSDNNGLFSLTGRSGKRLSVTLAKDGYYTPMGETLSTYEYANPGDGLFTPDSANPVVFHLRKKGQGVNLIHGSKLFGARVDGTLSYVDLAEGRNNVTPPGDLTVRCTRMERNAEKRFDWTFILGVPDGGLVESTNEFDFVAPEGGYQSAYQINHKASDPDWTGQEKHKFLVKSLGGQHYARIEITVIADYNQNAAYDVDWFLNPKGSRILEPMEAAPQTPALPPGAPPGAKAVIPEFK